MARKLILTIIVLSFAMLELLAVRQAQINTVHTMTQLHQQIYTDNEKINVLQIQIEVACSPSALQELVIIAEAKHEQP
jgi:hypothetical protein